MSLNHNNTISGNPGISILADVDHQSQILSFVKQIHSRASGVPCEVFLLGEASEIHGKTEKKINTFCNDKKDFRVRLIDRQDIPAASFNTALKESVYDLIHITDTSCIYEEHCIEAVVSAFRDSENTGIVSIVPYINDVKEKKQRQLVFESDVLQVDLNRDPQLWSGYLFSLFFRRNILEGIQFREELRHEYKRAFLADVYTCSPQYRFVPFEAVSSQYPDTDYYNYPPQYDLEWYLQELSLLADVLSDEAHTPIRQSVLMDFIRLQFACNVNNRNKGLLLGEELTEYKEKVIRALQHIEDDIVAGDDTGLFIKRLPMHCRNLFLSLKHGKQYLPIQCVSKANEDGEVQEYFMSDKAILARSDQFHANIRAMNINGDQLDIDGEMANTFFDDYDHFRLIARSSDGEELETVRDPVYNLYRVFGVTVMHGYNFRLSIPLSKKNKDYTIHLIYQGKEYTPRWRFTKPQARLAHSHEKCFWNTGKYCIRYITDDKCLRVETSNPLRTLINEIHYDCSIFKGRKGRASISRGMYHVALRLMYYLTKPYYSHQNIWITFDQLFKGGDNGEYFYRYVSEHGDKKQKIYYVANEDSAEYKELQRKYGTVLPHNSWKGRLVALHADIVFATRAGAIQYLGFLKEFEKFYRGLYNFDIVCLQHGLSIQKIAEYQNRLFDNLKYYFCVSKYEVENLSKPIYGYTDKSVLKLTGAPRYDGLHGEVKKQIIITPTWRRNVTSGTNTKGKNHEYSDNFKNTEYYRVYNKLINDEKLIDTARETGYRLIYLIHPILSPQINDFEKNDFLDIVPGSEVNYEKILTESAVMLTDHSGIMYDFAFQRKPMVYYHPDSLPPQYGEGGLKYETMGFGPVCKTHEQVVGALCDLMRNDCILEKKYEERIEDFFAFSDHNNCQRVYEAAREYQNQYQRKGQNHE